MSNSPTRARARELIDLIHIGPPQCVHLVPVEWQVLAAGVLCAQGDHELSIPGEWAVRAVEAHRDEESRPDLDMLVCLIGRAAEADGQATAELARALAARSVGIPPFRGFLKHARPDEAFHSLVREVLRVRPPTDQTWWSDFWTGLLNRGLELRPYLYLAAGQMYGSETLRCFIEYTIERETWSPNVGSIATAMAGGVLRRFSDVEPPPVARMIPESPRMRRVMLHSIPWSTMSPLSDTPWFASDVAQQRIREMWDDPSATGSDQDLRAWRGEYISNQWAYAGDEVSLRDLDTAFRDSDATILEFTREESVRFASALTAYVGRLASSNPTHNSRAHSIRLALAAAVRRAHPDALVALVYRMKGQLEEVDRRAAMAALLQERLHELPPKVQSILTQ